MSDVGDRIKGEVRLIGSGSICPRTHDGKRSWGTCVYVICGDVAWCGPRPVIGRQPRVCFSTMC
jgi:hypothetical protein